MLHGQPLAAIFDATLVAIAGVTTAADEMIYWTGPDAADTTALTPYARTLIAAADASAARTVLGVSSGGGGGVTDHGALTGLTDDDHSQYVLADGTRAFSGVVSGVTPTADAHLATKGYVDAQAGGTSDHGALTGLSDDDHPQYVLADGSRAFTAVVSGVTPTADAHLATKAYVDANSGGGSGGGLSLTLEEDGTSDGTTLDANAIVIKNAGPESASNGYLRFSVPAGYAGTANATLTLTVGSHSGNGSHGGTVRLRAEESTTPAAVSNAADIDGRTYTSTSVTVTIPEWDGTGTAPTVEVDVRDLLNDAWDGFAVTPSGVVLYLDSPTVTTEPDGGNSPPADGRMVIEDGASVLSLGESAASIFQHNVVSAVDDYTGGNKPAGSATVTLDAATHTIAAIELPSAGVTLEVVNATAGESGLFELDASAEGVDVPVGIAVAHESDVNLPASVVAGEVALWSWYCRFDGTVRISPYSEAVA